MNNEEQTKQMLEQILTLKDEMIKGFSALQEAILKQSGTKEEPIYDCRNYVILDDKTTLYLDKNEYGETIMSNPHCSIEDAVTYSPAELCVTRYPNIKLSRLLNDKGWYASNPISLDGLHVTRCYTERNYWLYNDDNKYPADRYTPNYYGRFILLLDKIRDIDSDDEGNTIKIEDLENVISLVDPESFVPDCLLEGKI